VVSRVIARGQVRSVLALSCTCPGRLVFDGHQCPGDAVLRFAVVDAGGALVDCRLVGDDAVRMAGELVAGDSVRLVGLFDRYARRNRFTGAVGRLLVEQVG
jgi:hypothetical protein